MNWRDFLRQLSRFFLDRLPNLLINVFGVFAASYALVRFLDPESQKQFESLSVQLFKFFNSSAVPEALFAIVATVAVLAASIAMFSLVRVRPRDEEDLDQEKLEEISRRISEIDRRQSENLQDELSEVTREITDLRGELANYKLQLTPWDRIFLEFQRRMDREKSRIRGASIVNLLLGLLFSLAALYVIAQSLGIDDVASKVLALQGKLAAASCIPHQASCASKLDWSPQQEMWFAFAQHVLPRIPWEYSFK